VPTSATLSSMWRPVKSTLMLFNSVAYFHSRKQIAGEFRILPVCLRSFCCFVIKWLLSQGNDTVVRGGLEVMF
jgi:hypothetical protein